MILYIIDGCRRFMSHVNQIALNEEGRINVM